MARRRTLGLRHCLRSEATAGRGNGLARDSGLDAPTLPQLAYSIGADLGSGVPGGAPQGGKRGTGSLCQRGGGVRRRGSGGGGWWAGGGGGRAPGGWRG